jgi:hypothetical protein
MLYAKLENDHWPLELEELEYVAKRLKHLNWAYDVEVQRSIFGSLPAHRFVLIKWEARQSTKTEPAKTNRNLIGEYKTKEEIIPMIRLLISAEEDVWRERGMTP